MKMKIILLSVLLLFSTNVVFSKEPTWLIKLKQLTPLQSTEKDVEQLFGKATQNQLNSKEYKIKDGLLEVEYSTGVCRENWNEFNVSKGKIIYITFTLTKPIRFESLKINVSNFEKEESSDTPNFIYKNNDFGIGYETYTKYGKTTELLTEVLIYPTNKFSYLECASK